MSRMKYRLWKRLLFSFSSISKKPHTRFSRSKYGIAPASTYHWKNTQWRGEEGGKGTTRDTGQMDHGGKKEQEDPLVGQAEAGR